MAGCKSLIVLCLSLCTLQLTAQTNRYMVFFKDKAGTPYAVTAPQQFLSQQAIDRRIKQGLSVDEADLPVNPVYVNDLKNTGAEVFFSTKWFNGALVQCDASVTTTIQNLSFVDRVEYVAPGRKLLNGGRRKTEQKRKTTYTNDITSNQLPMLAIPDMHADGFRGEGMTIAVFDAGFAGVNTVSPFQDLFREGRINTTLSKDFVYNSGNVFQYDEHGTEVLSTIAAYVPDAFIGGAYKANFQLYVTEDVTSEYRVEEYNWLFAAERADSSGVDIINSSLGYYDFDDNQMNYTKAQMDGKTTVVTRAAQLAADRGIAVVVSAGNEGGVPSWRIIAAPADAVDVLATANVDTNGRRSPSSSIGPSADGRIKPDLAALGTAVKAINPAGNVVSASGTSLAAPLLTSLVAGTWQRFPNLTNKELIALLKRTASQAGNPDNNIGYGIPNYKRAVEYELSLEEGQPFQVYPNPVENDSVTIALASDTTIGPCRVEMVASNGQVIGESQLDFSGTQKVFQTNLNGLSSGLYFLRITTPTQRFIFKLVKL